LLVDDNPELRQLATRQLTELGYKVLSAENGSRALEALRSEERFDLLFTDIGLPDGMDGYELARAAQQMRPGLKVLFTTGYAKVQQPEAAHMLRKPYRKQALAAKTKAALDSPI
jgi:CheY-like chemotaxis protein